MTSGQYRKSTIKDVAAYAGVSTTTVSEFMSGRERACSAQTAQRIRAAISELHYTPSSLMRGHRQRATRIIGVCMVNPHEQQAGIYNEFVERLWNSIIQVADAEDCLLLHYPASIRKASACDAFLDGSVDGVLFSTRSRDTRPATISAAGMPIVMLQRPLHVAAGCGSVYANEADTVHLALSHLWALGHRRIAHLAGPVDKHPLYGPFDLPEAASGPNDIATVRRDSYIRWLQARDAFDPSLLGFGYVWSEADHHVQQAVSAWRQLSDPPTAVFCANDPLALGVLQAARAMGWRVPHELSIVGVDNRPVGAQSDPPLSSVAAPVEATGQEATRTLIRLMNGAPVEACRVAVPVTELVIRGSTAPPRT